MITKNATDVRRDWSSVMESAIRERPQFIKRTRDYLVLADMKLLATLLSGYRFTAVRFNQDGSVTLSLRELDLTESAATEAEAKLLLGKSILDYAEFYYSEFSIWSNTPSKKNHVPYVMKALIIDDAAKIGNSIVCQAPKT